MTYNPLNIAIEAIKNGDKEKGKDILIKLLTEEPNNELGWMWLAACHSSIEQKIYCLNRVLEINPDNVNAKTSLNKLQQATDEPSIDIITSTSQNNEADQLSQKIIQQVNQPQSIKFIPANCPNCGGELRLPTDKTVVKCMYCGYDILIHDPTKINVDLNLKIDISKPLKIAQVAEQGGNYHDGYKYYSQVLEQDPENTTAWLGRARCTALRGSIQSQTFDEAISYVRTALDLSNVNEDDLGFTLEQITKAIVAYTILVKEDIQAEWIKANGNPTLEPVAAITQSIGRAATIKQINKKFVEEYFSLILRTLSFCWSTLPTRNIGAGIYMTISEIMNIDALNSETLEYLNIKLQPLIEEVKKKYPEIPLPAKKKSCFIATAAMGDNDHPYVETLRIFRDQVLSKNKYG